MTVVGTLAQNKKILELIAREESVRKRIDEKVEKWTKKYFGGAHFSNWLELYKEVWRKECEDRRA